MGPKGVGLERQYAGYPHRRFVPINGYLRSIALSVVIQEETMDNKRQIFVSYSHKDKRWLERLRTFLQPFEREAELWVWSDKEIKIGSNWHADIQKALNEAEAAILLISQDFLASDYIASNELPQLLSAANERGLHIYPVIVSSCFLKNSPLSSFQAVDSRPLDKLDKAKQNEIFNRLAETIDELLKVALVGVTEEWLEKFRSRFVTIAGGSYVLGDDELQSRAHALAEHEKSVDSFRLGQYVVTQSEWFDLMNTRPWVNQKNTRYGDNNPAVWVNWHQAIDFIGKINKADIQFSYRLPTEAEWEYAARGGQKTLSKPRTKFSFGDDANKLIEYGWYNLNASERGESYAHPVGELKGNQLNLFDMHGNVWEWTSDNTDGLPPLRGGGFNFIAEGASSAFRVLAKPDFTSEAVGFRLVQEPKM